VKKKYKDNLPIITCRYEVKDMSEEKESSTGVGVQLSLREQLLGRLSDEDLSSKKREVSVMTRMSNEIVEILDALVELEIFKSRSEAVSAFVEQAISARMSMFEEIKSQATDIRQLRDSAKKHAYKAFQEESK
jgi:Arc/MetJ-type ribon-helix-helix transcriptional regulator